MEETLVFFGNGPVAAESLALLAKDFKVEAVVTKPKPPHHRGEFPVVKLAEQLGLPTYTPVNKKELSDLFAANPVKSRLGLVIDYGLIIPQDVIDYFPLGVINSHFSLLPEWRGADPISFAILSGQTETGVSLMLIDARMDEGPLLDQAAFTLPPDITTPELTAELIKISRDLLVKNIPGYVSGTIKPIPQDPDITPTYSRKLTKEDGIIDWNKPAKRIEREIRAYQDWPKSRTTLAGKDVIITKAHTIPSSTPETEPGDVKVKKETGVIMVCTGNGNLCIERLKPAGKREMSSREFLAGYGHLLS